MADYKAEDIQVMEWHEHIRRRPGMYIGNTDSRGIVNLFGWLITGSIQVLNTRRLDFEITIKENARYNFTIKNVKDVNCLKNAFTVQTYQEWPVFYLYVAKALCVEFEITEGENSLSVDLRWDTQILKHPEADYTGLANRLTMLAMLNRETTILLRDVSKPVLQQNYFHFPEGLQRALTSIKQTLIQTPDFELSYDDEYEGNKYQIIVAKVYMWEPINLMATYVNDEYMVHGGDLLDGVLDGLVAGTRTYVSTLANESYKVKRKSFKDGIVLLAAVRGEGLEYRGSSRTCLNSAVVRKQAKHLTQQMLLNHFKVNPDEAAGFIGRFCDVTGSEDV